MKKILISVGPIYGKLDSVKIITNIFKGGLASLTAKKLAEMRPKDEITLIRCNGTEIFKSDEKVPHNMKIVTVNNFYEYETFVLSNKFDAYILAAAVANLIPQKPYEGKFPSHNYKEGDVVNIPFLITPRVISRVKEKYPRTTLIGYKLLDGSEDELILAGWKTLVDSKANAVFCNSPKTAKEKKICLLPDGAKIEMTFDEHINFINRILNLKWYKTKIEKIKYDFDSGKFFSLLEKTAENFFPYQFGCVAVRASQGFITTIRGKTEKNRGLACVSKVYHGKRIVYADQKASMNAPLLDLIFKKTGTKIILHSHRKINAPDFDYVFSGTSEEDELGEKINDLTGFNIRHHGYYKWFESFTDAEKFLTSQEIDWENYEKVFPERYISDSTFDNFVKSKINKLSQKRKITVLEIGANKTARYFDKSRIAKYFSYDKYVALDNRDAIVLKELRNDNYDLIVFRNSVNYLSDNELKKVADIARKCKAAVVFNTFKSPTKMERAYKSKVSYGTESSVYCAKQKKIIHTLKPADSQAITHSFFYYSQDEFEAFFGGFNMSVMEKGSTLYFYLTL